MKRNAAGFTLVEVLVGLGIVAIALIAGLQASAALTRDAERQADRVLAQLCAKNSLAKIRLERQFPDVGESTTICHQAHRAFDVHLRVQTTPNPGFRRVDVRVTRDDFHILQLSTIAGRY